VKDGADERLPPRSGWALHPCRATRSARGHTSFVEGEAFAPATSVPSVPSRIDDPQTLSSARRCGSPRTSLCASILRECLEIIREKKYAEKLTYSMRLAPPPR